MKRATFGLIAYTMAGDADFSDLESEFRKLDKEGSDQGLGFRGLGFSEFSVRAAFN